MDTGEKFVMHARSAHFALILLSFTLLISVSISPTSEVSDAYAQTESLERQISSRSKQFSSSIKTAIEIIDSKNLKFAANLDQLFFKLRVPNQYPQTPVDLRPFWIPSKRSPQLLSFVEKNLKSLSEKSSLESYKVAWDQLAESEYIAFPTRIISMRSLLGIGLVTKYSMNASNNEEELNKIFPTEEELEAKSSCTGNPP